MAQNTVPANENVGLALTTRKTTELIFRLCDPIAKCRPSNKKCEEAAQSLFDVKSSSIKLRLYFNFNLSNQGSLLVSALILSVSN